MTLKTERTTGAGMGSRRFSTRVLWTAGVLALASVLSGGPASRVFPPVRAAIEPNAASSAYYEDALMLADEGEFKAAVIQLKNALARDPDHLAARLLLGEAFTKLGHFAAAIDAFEGAASLGADESLVAVPLFRAHLLARDYQKILADIDINSRPRSIRSDLLLIRGHAQLEIGNYIDAERDFGEAATLAPSDAAPLVGKALVHFNRATTGELSHSSIGPPICRRKTP